MPPQKKFPSAAKKRPALGRGLDDVFADNLIETKGSSSISEIELSRIYPNPDQPRREIDPEALSELAESIASIGIVQPITLRQMGDGSYQIIAGERRWRASQIAGLATIPAYVRTASDENVMEMALVENIQRQDLNPIEVALAYNNLIERLHLTQEQLAEKVGKKRATVANSLRLLKLPAQVQIALRKGEIDQGHARALLGVANPAQLLKLFQQVKDDNMPVSKVEKLVQDLNSGAGINTKKVRLKSRNQMPEEYELLKAHLSEYFGAKVQMTCASNGKGRISIPFNSSEDLDRLIALFDKMKG